MKKFANLDNIENTHTFKDLLRWQRERRSNKKDLTQQIQQSTNKEPQRLKENRSIHSITWIGHSTFLLQVGGLNILTDPVWAPKMGLQKRLTAPGLSAGQLPDIDLVLISHGHYDHLDFNSIKQLKGKISFYVPAGLKGLFRKKGYQAVTEANWWEEFVERGLKIMFVPAQHWSRRSAFDMNTSHWGGWVIEDLKTGESVYFAGDTGYFRGFRDIGERLKPDTVLMPIGAYEPEWFMKVSHINPEDAVKAFLETGASLFIPMHYGAYRLADDTGPEALRRLEKEWEKQSLDEARLKVLSLGETLWKQPVS
ncbi:L-ascorbate metabolism protein UlaG, beta-lactamase superfamily [Fictibacillus enclensis]|uniref:MBL fold metallo-hydrolase n=1 Tax=Fictibacillus enclensis TaxID=1017270 RepID=A0A0V8J1P9_9BACL|nr:MBL fold metallo-hydrolase [Fictibacillus enclensis]KSU80932.1 MBL fold metallo-hydrolase [Fictibacillus enclensis]SCC33077.1 L-ascorbate metabolism protein UlaG, beta-lactamase superfamily [Fictibacillus enclensis]